jgi:aminocarboxymuconate-semialdehyde decarboxylase
MNLFIHPQSAPRSDHACFVSPKNCNPDIKLKKKPTEYLNQLYFDALVFTPEALRHLVAQVGASQIMLGSDHPIPWEEHPVDHVCATESLNRRGEVGDPGRQRGPPVRHEWVVGKGRVRPSRR